MLSFGPGSGPAGQVFEECLVAVRFLQKCRGSGNGSSNNGGGGGGLCLVVAALLRSIFSDQECKYTKH